MLSFVISQCQKQSLEYKIQNARPCQWDDNKSMEPISSSVASAFRQSEPRNQKSVHGRLSANTINSPNLASGLLAAA